MFSQTRDLWTDQRQRTIKSRARLRSLMTKTKEQRMNKHKRVPGQAGPGTWGAPYPGTGCGTRNRKPRIQRPEHKKKVTIKDLQIKL